MNPVLAWLLQHPRDQWQDPAVRAAFQATRPDPVTDREWNVGLARAYQSERVGRLLEEAHGNYRVENLLRGRFALQEYLTVPFRITGQYANGTPYSDTLYVRVHRSEYVSQFRDAVAAAAAASTQAYELINTHVEMMLGAFTTE